MRTMSSAFSLMELSAPRDKPTPKWKKVWRPVRVHIMPVVVVLLTVVGSLSLYNVMEKSELERAEEAFSAAAEPAMVSIEAIFASNKRAALTLAGALKAFGDPPTTDQLSVIAEPHLTAVNSLGIVKAIDNTPAAIAAFEAEATQRTVDATTVPAQNVTFTVPFQLQDPAALNASAGEAIAFPLYDLFPASQRRFIGIDFGAHAPRRAAFDLLLDPSVRNAPTKQVLAVPLELRAFGYASYIWWVSGW